MGRARFVLKFGLHFLFQDPRIRRSPSDRQKSSSEGSNCLCTSTSGDFVRWESRSEGSNRRCKSLATKALSAAANSIKTLILISISIRFTLYYFSAWFALIVVLNRTAQTVATVLITARYAMNLGIDRNEQVADSACVASAERRGTQQPNVLTPNAANAAARPTKAL